MSLVIDRRLRILTCGTLLVLLLVGFTAAALAAPQLTWHTDSVYYDSQGRIVIEGYFYNSGTRTITWVNRHDLQVWFRQNHTNWWHHASASFYDLNIQLHPGDSVRWTFRIYNVEYAYFNYWNVKWNVNYNYR